MKKLGWTTAVLAMTMLGGAHVASAIMVTAEATADGTATAATTTVGTSVAATGGTTIEIG